MNQHHNEHEHEYDNNDWGESDYDDYGDGYEEEPGHESGHEQGYGHDHEPESGEENWDESAPEEQEEPHEEEKPKSNLKKYLLAGAAAIGVAGAGSFVLGNHNQSSQPQIQTQPVRQNPQMAFHNPAPPPQMQMPRNQSPAPASFSPPPQHMGQHNPNGIYDPSVSPQQRQQMEHEAMDRVTRALDEMGHRIHDDITSTSQKEEKALTTRIDRLQTELTQVIHDRKNSDEEQINALRDMVSALKETLRNQQDTINSLRSEMTRMRSASPAPVTVPAPTPAPTAPAPTPAATHATAPAATSLQTPSSAPVPPATQAHQHHGKSSGSRSHSVHGSTSFMSQWHLRGYDSSRKVAIVQSPQNQFYEESIGYEARDENGASLGIGTLRGVSIENGKHVLKTTRGLISE